MPQDVASSYTKQKIVVEHIKTELEQIDGVKAKKAAQLRAKGKLRQAYHRNDHRLFRFVASATKDFVLSSPYEEEETLIHTCGIAQNVLPLSKSLSGFALIKQFLKTTLDNDTPVSTRQPWFNEKISW